MTLIVFEGIDNCGKTHVIKQLIEKYPDKFDSFAFPTPYFLDQKLSIEKDGMYKYHMEFEIDFVRNQDHIQQSKKILLLDRYFISNMVYSYINSYKYSNHYISLVIKNIEHPHVIPDLVIYLDQDNPKDFEHDGTYTVDELLDMQICYYNILMELHVRDKIKRFRMIDVRSREDRNKNLLGKVEDVLKENGFI